MRDFNALTEVTGTRRLDPLFPGSPFSTKLNFTKFTFSPLNTHVFKGKKVNLVKFNFVEKGGSTGKRGSRRRVPVTEVIMCCTIIPPAKLL